jgi:hypothetical protein
MKKGLVLTFILSLTISYMANAQLLSDLYKIYSPISQNTSGNDSTSIYSPFGIIKPGKPVYNLSFGASYTSFGRGVGYSSSSITPTIAYAPNDKLQIFAGASISYNNLNKLSSFNRTGINNNLQSTGNPTQVFAYGQYQINNKFNVYAMGTFAKNQLYVSPFYGGGIGTADYQEFGVGFNYKLSSKASIGASFNFAHGPGYFSLSPSGYNGFNSMFP